MISASRTPAVRIATWRITLNTVIPSLTRSSNGFSATTRKAAFGSARPSMKLRPTTPVMSATPGMSLTSASTCSVTSVVRLTAAAAGSFISTKNSALVLIRQEAGRAWRC